MESLNSANLIGVILAMAFVNWELHRLGIQIPGLCTIFWSHKIRMNISRYPLILDKIGPHKIHYISKNNPK